MTRRRAPTFTRAQVMALAGAQAITPEAQARGDRLMRGERDANQVYETRGREGLCPQEDWTTKDSNGAAERSRMALQKAPAKAVSTAVLHAVPQAFSEFLTAAAAASPEIAKAARAGKARRTSPSEHVEQVAVIRWCQSQEWRWPELAEIFAVPNGGLRDEIAGAKLKAEGAKRGVEDLFLDVPRGQYHGLRIEMKRIDASPSDTSKEQRERIATHIQRGYRAVVCKGATAAIAELTWYLGLPEFGILEGRG